MSAWDEYRAAVKVSPGDIVDRNGLPVVLDLGHRPPGYRPGTYRCLPCGRDPYDPRCCRQCPPCRVCGRRVRWLGSQWTANDGTIACTDTSAPFVPHKPEEWP